jgi:hypothetical protein
MPRRARDSRRADARSVPLTSRVIIAALVAALLLPAAARAQTPVRLSRAPACKGCNISVTKLLTLGTADDTVTHFYWITIDRDSKGRYYVAPTMDKARVAVYDASGRFLRLIGRQGQGPGEFEYISTLVVDRADSLHLFDGWLRRHTVITPNHTVRRTSSIPGQAEQAVLLPNGILVTQSVTRSRDGVGLPVHVITPDGRLLRSVGTTERDLPRNVSAPLYRRLAPASDSSVWSARLERYEIEEWDVQGRRLVVLTSDADWFPPWQWPDQRQVDERRPQPLVRAIQRRSDGTLWLLATVATTNWKPAPGVDKLDPRREERPILHPSEYGKYLDTVIELIDPKQGTLVASTRVPGAFLGFAGADQVYTRRETPDGGEVLEIWRVGLNQP